jgi:hypothetical protein
MQQAHENTGVHDRAKATDLHTPMAVINVSEPGTIPASNDTGEVLARRLFPE